MKRYKKYTPLLFCVMVSACVEGPTRLCPPYSATGDDVWVPGLVGTTYKYSNQSGDSVEYVISDVVLSTSYVATSAYGRGVSEDLPCHSSRYLTLLSRKDDRGLSIRITHSDDPGRPLNEFDIVVRVHSFIVNEEERDQLQKVILRITKLEYLGLGKWAKQSYNETLLLKGRIYRHVLSIFAPEIDFQENPEVKTFPHALKRFVLARGDGMIRFERNDGSVFNLVSVER